MTNYDQTSIEVLDDLEHIQRRPGMYIGSTDNDGVFQIFVEVFDNSLDEYLAGHATCIQIEINTKVGWALVRDDGRGIPTEIHAKTGVSTLTTVLTTLQSGGKFGKQAYAISAGLHGVGIKATNALSEWLEVAVWRKGKCWQQKFAKGAPTTPVEANTARNKVLKHGTEMSFQPDPAIFGKNELDVGRIRGMIEELVYLCPGLNIILTVDEDEAESYTASGGLSTFLAQQSLGSHLLGKVFEIVSDDESIAVSLLWTADKDDREHWWAYCNLKATPEFGTHVTGVKRAITKALGDLTDKRLHTNDFRAGLYAAVHVKLGEPLFKGQTKQKLQNSETDGDVYELLLPVLVKWFAKNHGVAKAIIDRAVHLRKAKEQYKRLKEATSSITIGKRDARGVLPGKLVEAPHCKPEDRELYLVEGDSAAGTAVGARDPNFQEVLPLRGKILNAQRAGTAAVLQNEEIKALITATGVNIDPSGQANDYKKLRVGKIMLLCDADPDGQHITTLILSFIVNYMWELVEQERVYVVHSPLFRATNNKGSEHWYADSIPDIEKQSGLPADRLLISRLKGHGEADAHELKYYAMNAATRKLIKLSYDQKQYEDFAKYMGDNSDARKAILGIA